MVELYDNSLFDSFSTNATSYHLLLSDTRRSYRVLLFIQDLSKIVILYFNVLLKITSLKYGCNEVLHLKFDSCLQ